MHTFDDVSHVARRGIELNQGVGCHGSVTNVVKTAPNVVKTVVKTAFAEASADGLAGVGHPQARTRSDVGS